jgi:cytochrome c-type biogenesis protein CcmH
MSIAATSGSIPLFYREEGRGRPSPSARGGRVGGERAGFWIALMIVLAVLAHSAWAGEAAPAAADPRLEKRAMALASELRCLVCQNQTLADSNAPLALDLKNQIREQLAKGMSERDIVDYLVARYGDFVLYRPPVKATTLLLWIGPFLLLAVGVFVLVRRIAGRRAAPPELSEAERQAAAKLLGEGDAPR